MDCLLFGVCVSFDLNDFDVMDWVCVCVKVLEGMVVELFEMRRSMALSFVAARM